MEMKRLFPISIIILAVSVVFSSVWIGQSIEKGTKAKISNTQTSFEKALLTEREAAEYLNISIDEFKNMLLKDNQDKEILLKDSQEKGELMSFPTYKFIPHLEISDGNMMFSKKELDELFVA